jgi:hypothetical protein
MDDLVLEILMGAVLLGIVLRLCWKGNPRPSLFVAIGGAMISAIATFRRLELSDIILPLVVAVIAGAIAAVAHRVRSGPFSN